MTDKHRDPAYKLNQLEATAICGNDITSSCLYVSALTVLQAGKWAPVALLIVAAVLFLYRKIYAEVVGALPLNGGAYNALLNTTSKRVASLAACLTLLSYMATAVISASEAMHYVHSLWHGLPVIAATIVLLAAFMFLTIMGIGESARVAVLIFITHITTLVLLLGVGVFFVLRGGPATLGENLTAPMEISVPQALFFGFAAAMLGISGFESSANFVEEQERGVFPKTLRNMWAAVSFFNPSMALLALALVPISAVAHNQEALLSHMGLIAGGKWLSVLVSVDAALVLSGAVLTSYVGVTGLVKRMALDRCLPQFLLRTNRLGTTHWIIIAFFLLAVSVLLWTQGNLGELAGVYTISFLAVMALFGVGNILLKIRRASLPRPTIASWPSVLVAIAAVVAALVGNILLNPAYLRVFLGYFVPAILIVGVMLSRIEIMRIMLFAIQSVSESIQKHTSRAAKAILDKIDQINSQRFVFFTRGDSIANLNQAMLYVRRNEHTNRIRVAIAYTDKKEIPERLAQDLEFLDEAYPEIDIEYVEVEGEFGPELIDKLSKRWQVPKNFMFIGSPGDHFPYRLEELGGVRLII
ncbi:MAG: APC family permease [Acidobacteria bacterium]|jgi:amino acid transporter|nr:APC family permease [Acidobacteriota bacterium]